MKMKKLAVLVISVATVSFANQVLADTNIALGKAVTLNGAFGTDSGGWTSMPSAAGSTLTDGSFFSEQTQWDMGSVWWNANQNPGNNAVIDLGGLFNISSFVVQADDNDTYRIEYSVGGGSWSTAWDVPTFGSFGLVTRPEYTLGAPILADELRFTATGGDNLYAVSEIQAFGSPVPEPETYALFMAGLGLMGFMARRRKQKQTT